MEPDKPKPYLSNQAYDAVKKGVQVVLPAIGSLYFALSAIWDLPATEQVLGSIAVFTTFLGTILGVSSKRYDASDAGLSGEFVVNQDGGGAAGYSLVLNADPEVLADQERITFRVLQKPV
jgi:Putative phage holin Dp-1